MGVSITYFLLSFPCLLQEPFIRYGASLSLVSVWPCQDDMHMWQTRLNAGFQVSLVVESCVRGLDNLEVGARLRAIRRLSSFEPVILVLSHLHTPYGSVSGLGSRSVQVLWSYKRKGGYSKSSSLDQFQGNHSCVQASAIAAYSGRTELTVIDLGNGLDSGMLLVSVPFCLLPC